MTDLVERERELDVLQRLVDGAGAGRGSVVLIEGPAGIGKSGLLAELRAAATGAGVRVLTARAGELERDFPFGVVRQLFDPALADPATRERWMAEAAASAGAVFGAPSATGDAAAQDASFSALHGLHWLAVNATADGPLVLAIDDLHCCDRASLRFLAYLARRLDGLPVVVAATLRTGEPDTDLALVSEFTSDPDTTLLRPGPLTPGAVAVLVGARLGVDADPAFCDACSEATGGNPLLLRQLLSALEDDGVRPDAVHVGVVRDTGPRAASRGVLVRLARLPDGAIAVARAVAVLGESATLPTVASLAGMDEAAAASSIADLARTEILTPGPPLAFVHPLVRDAVHRELQPGERELAHDRAARLLMETGASADQVAAHLLHVPCRGEAWVAELLTDAARSANRRGAPESAAAYFRRALAEPPAPELVPPLLFELGLTAWAMEGNEAIPNLQRAFTAQTDPLFRGLAGFGLARTYLFSDTPRRCREIAAKVLEGLPPELDDLGLALRALDAFALHWGGGGDASPGRLAEYRVVPPGAGLGARMLASMAVFDAMLAVEPAADCAAWAKDILDDGSLIAGDPGLFVVAPILTLAVADQSTVAVWDDFATTAHRNGSAFSVLTLNIWSGYTQLLCGELAEAEYSIREGLHQGVLWGLGPGSNMAYAEAFLALTRAERGNIAGARAALPAMPPDDDVSDGGNHARSAHAAVLLLEGRPEEALALTVPMEGLTRQRHPLWNPWRSLRAQALHALGDTTEAIELARAELDIARGSGADNLVGRGLRIVGELRGADGVDELREACALLARSTARSEHARALVGLGAALRAARAPTEAREPLRLGLDLADRCGADGLAERARSELYATGSRPRTTAMAGVEALTARERRVADLVAGGATNRDVAQALYVTPKTVEVHLSNTYRKLGIRSRRELAGALA